jgi:hypothetical protein
MQRPDPALKSTNSNRDGPCAPILGNGRYRRFVAGFRVFHAEFADAVRAENFCGKLLE